MKYIDKTTKSGKVVKLKNYKKRVKINKIKRKILLFLFIIICILSILLFAPFMKIKKINCVGNTVNNSNDIISVSGISIGDNLIRINKIKAKKDITEKFPYIKNIDIKRNQPIKENKRIFNNQSSNQTDKTNFIINN
ncbi:MAG: FtsQ-type POTRA domain-containing protein [Clostridia bacterium]|nr:FtsQ-type POTRA domain-containing protein [Clostridia bacterium]